MSNNSKRKRAEKNVTPFTDLGIRRLNVEKRLREINTERRKKHREANLPMKEFREVNQALIWDKVQKGLSLLISAGGTKAFRSTYKLDGEWQTRSFGRFGEMVANPDPDEENVEIGKARKTVANDRALARKGINPKVGPEQPAEEKKEKKTFEYVVDQFIEHYAKPRQRTWDQTERILKTNCAPLLKKPITDISKGDIRTLLRGFIAEGHSYKAGVTYAWLKKLWRWAATEDLVTTPIMEAVKIDYSKRKRTRVYSDEQIKALWVAADKLEPEGAFIKLMMLLSPRKTALVGMRFSELARRKIKITDADGRVVEQELDLWITPPEQVKQSKRAQETEHREYLTPLPPLALRILKGIKKEDGQERVFAGLPLYVNKKTGRLQFQRGRWLYKRLAEVGGPKFNHADYHAWRHTLATWMENEGYSKEERGLLLNHKETGVTAGYSHGYALKLKYKLLCEWADHVEGLVTAKGVRRLR